MTRATTDPVPNGPSAVAVLASEGPSHSVEEKAQHRRLPTPDCEPHADCKSAWGFVWDGSAGDFVKVRIDLDFVPRFNAHRWRLDSQGYAVTQVWLPAEGRVLRLTLHRMVTNAPTGVLVDHRFGNLRDARRCVLRFATHCQNSANRRSSRRNKSARFRGVTLHKQSGKWQAQAKHKDKFIHGGLHVTQEAAALAYNAIARHTWGAFAVLNRVRARKKSRNADDRAA